MHRSQNTKHTTIKTEIRKEGQRKDSSPDKNRRNPVNTKRNNHQITTTIQDSDRRTTERIKKREAKERNRQTGEQTKNKRIDYTHINN